MFSPEKMVEAMTKVASALTMKKHPKTYQGTQYKEASSYIGREWLPQLACGADGTLQPNITCFYSKDTANTKKQLCPVE